MLKREQKDIAAVKFKFRPYLGYGRRHQARCLLLCMEPKLREFPHSFPISPDASALGVLGYQQLLIAPYRIVFEIVEDRKEVAVYLVLRQNQSLEPALIRYCLVAPIL